MSTHSDTIEKLHVGKGSVRQIKGAGSAGHVLAGVSTEHSGKTVLIHTGDPKRGVLCALSTKQRPGKGPALLATAVVA